MANLNELLLAEATEYEFKSALEEKKPKSWLKTVSAFANGAGGRFFYGVDDDGTIIGLEDVKGVTEKISKLIQARISPMPDFSLTPQRVAVARRCLYWMFMAAKYRHTITWLMAARQRMFA
jgi:predicted HTH transcriptional regulator